METVSIDQAKADLSHLVERAAQGESFIIAKAGKPLVQVIALDPMPVRHGRRLGFLIGRISVPDDFDRMGDQEIDRLFGAAG